MKVMNWTPYSPNHLKQGYSHYPKVQDPTQALKSTTTESEYMQAYSEWMAGYDHAAGDDNTLENNHYDDAQP